MKDTSKTKQSLALLGAVLMIVSMVAAGFAGSAAADVQTIEGGIDAPDVNVGSAGVDQEVTLASVENDQNPENITISPSMTGTITGATVTADNGHDATATVDGNNVVIEMAGSSGNGPNTDNIDVTITHDLSSVDAESSDGDVTYTTSVENGSANAVSDSFNLLEPEPAFSQANVSAENPDQLNVTFTEPVEQDGTTSEINSAFTFTGSPSVDGVANVNGQSVILNLDGYVSSSEDLSGSLEYDGSNNSDPIIHANEDRADVGATDFTGGDAKDVNNNAVPVVDTAEVTDSGDLAVTFSEAINVPGSNVEDAFELTGTGNLSEQTIDGNSGVSTDTLTLTLSSGTDIVPGDDFNNALDYDAGSKTIEAAAGSDETVATFSNQDVENNRKPAIVSAEITNQGANEEANELRVTFDGDISVVGDDSAVSSAFNFRSGDASVTGYNASETTNRVVVLDLGSSVTSGADYDTAGTDDLEYTDGSGTAIASTSGTSTDTASNTDVANNVEPQFDTAEVTSSNPDQLRVTFSENIKQNPAISNNNDNINTEVTDTFSFDGYRVHTFTGIENGDTVVLNLAEQDGTAQTVSFDEDLSSSLSYNPGDGETGDPFVGDNSENVPAPAFSNEDVNNNVNTEVTAEISENGQYLNVTFTEDINRVGTVSDLMDSFSYSDDETTDVVELTDNAAFEEIDGDTVVFNNGNAVTDGGDFVKAGQEDNYNSELDTPTVTYTASAGDSPLEFASDNSAVEDTDSVDITNNIQPFITDATLDAGNNKITLTYSEPVTEPSGSADDFELQGTSVSISEKTTLEDSEKFELDITGDFQTGDNPVLDYTGADDKVVSPNDNEAFDQQRTLTNPASPAPTLMNATVDDVNNNNNGNDGEMVLAFDRPVQQVPSSGGDASGLIIDEGTNEVNIKFDSSSAIDDSPSGDNDNLIVVNFTSVSGSVDSSVQEGEDLSGATITIDDPGNVDIESKEGEAVQADDSTSNVNNEIAGELATVESTEIDTELIGTEVDDTGGDFTVTVTGLRDSSGNRVIDDTVQVNISGATPGDLEVSPNRFSDTATTSETPEDINKDNVEIGSEATVDVNGADVTDAATVTYVHEAFTASEGYQFESQPMPGEFVSTENISDITYYDADAGADEESFATYGSESEVQDVHNALFVNAETAGAEYGFDYDEDRSGPQTNVGSIEMGEGWHIVGSNYDIGQNDQIDLSEDLATQNSPGSSEKLDAQKKTLPGTTLADDDGVENHAVYYVFVYEGEQRAIVLPEYTGTNSGTTGNGVV